MAYLIAGTIAVVFMAACMMMPFIWLAVGLASPFIFGALIFMGVYRRLTR